MKTALLTFVLLAGFTTSCSNTSLEGTWNCQSAVVDGKTLSEKTVGQLRLTLTRDRYKTEKGKEVLFDSTYTIDPSKKPKQIDMVGTEGELTGKKAQGIFKIERDDLWVCYTMPGKDRPTAFESPPGSGAYFIVWKRAAQSQASVLSFWFNADTSTRWDAVVIAVVAVLTCELYLRIRRRSRRRLSEAYWTGHGIDVSDIAGRVERVRRDFIGASHARLHESSQSLLASARKIVAQLPYFRRHKRRAADVEMTNDEAQMTKK